MTRCHLYTALLVGVLLSACGLQEPTMDKSAVKIQLDIVSMSVTDVSVCITHNGSNRDAYYGVLTQDSITDARAFVTHYLDSVGHDQVLEDAWYQRKRIENFHNLMPYECYRLVVFMLNDRGLLSGEPTLLLVQTESNVEFERNANWAVSYTGVAIYDEIYKSKILCDVLDESMPEPYYASTISAEEWQKCGGLTAAVYYLLGNAKKNMEEDESWYSLNVVSRVGINLYSYRTPGDYYALMIGINADGSPTGKYAMSEKFHVDAYEMVAGYKALLGNWQMTDATGRVDTLEIVSNEVNRSMTMFYLGGKLWPVTIKYEPTEDFTYVIYAQCVARDITITASDNTRYTSNVYLYAWYMDDDKKVWRVTGTNTLAAFWKEDDDHFELKNAYYYTDEKNAIYGIRYNVFYEGTSLRTLSNSTYTFPCKLTRLP